MKIFDFECKDCGHIEEIFMFSDFDESTCSKCGGQSHKIFTPSGTPLTDPDWIRDVQEVVDKSGAKPWCNEMLKNPTRANYKEWMRREGLRHLEPGESNFPKVDRDARRQKTKRYLIERMREREAVSI